MLYKKPFPGSHEYRKNINEFKKNKIKTVELDKKSSVTNLVVNSSNTNFSNNSDNGNNHSNNVSTVSCSHNNYNEGDNDKEVSNQ